MATTNALSKQLTGISGLDAITNGGLPQNRCTLLLGGPGSGKTVLALQILANSARMNGEPGIFVAFEERTSEILANAASFGWDISDLIDQGLFFLDAHLPSDAIACGDFDLTGLLAGLKAKVEEMNARWIVFDAIDVFLSFLNNHSREMRELYRLREWLAETGLTGLITSKFDDNNEACKQRYSSLQFLTDCVVRLNHRMLEQVSLRELQVVKYRGSAFAENVANFVIGPKGFEVSDVSIPSERMPASNEKVSSGIERLDTMLAGGYYRGSVVLQTGLPGTAKTTLAGAFAENACLQGEKVLYLAFDEPPEEIVRNLGSVNINLAPHVESKQLAMIGARTDGGSGEEHFLRIVTLVKEHRATCVVIDPVSTLMRTGGSILAVSVARRLVLLAKRLGITLLLTALQDTEAQELPSDRLHISTLADTWIHLTYHESAGERNRAISIVKSRGSAHSNQLRELILSSDGVTLADVYRVAGAVQMGTMRWEAEEHEQHARLVARQQQSAKRREIELNLEDLKSRIAVLHKEIELREEHMAILDEETTLADQQQENNASQRNQLRGADI